MQRKYSPEGIVASVLLIGLFLVVLVQVFGRTPLYVGPIWTEELARWLWVWMAFIGIAEVERTDSQLSMGFVAEALPKRAQVALYTLIDVVYLGIMLNLSVIGYGTILRTWSNETVTLPTSDALLYASAFVASFLILHRIARRIVVRLKTGTTTEVSP